MAELSINGYTSVYICSFLGACPQMLWGKNGPGIEKKVIGQGWIEAGKGAQLSHGLIVLMWISDEPEDSDMFYNLRWLFSSFYK